MLKGSDKRAHHRIPLKVPVLWARADDAKAERLGATAELSDLAEGGLFVRTPVLQPVGSVLDLWIAPEGVPMVHVRGVVVRTTPDGDPGMGIRLEPDDGPTLMQRLLSISKGEMPPSSGSLGPLS